MPSEAPGVRTVLVVDDSALIRRVVSEVIAGFEDFRVVGTARDGHDALLQIRALNPDIVTLDVEMPGLDGIATLDCIMRDLPRAVVMLSAAESRGEMDLTLRALELGAVDFVRKHTLAGTRQVLGVAGRLHEALRAAAVVNLRGVPPMARAVPPLARARPELRSARAALAVACSTGGPRALAEIVPLLPSDLDAAVLVVQHMPRGFTRGLAERLDQLSTLGVTEARHGELVLPNHVYVAPGGLHMTVVGDAAGTRVALDDSPPVWGVKPAADLLFHTAAARFGAECVGIVLTGMGCDGSAGLDAIRRAGGGAVVQDRETATIYGMPNSALQTAGADRIVPLGRVLSAAAELLAERRAAK